MCIGIIVDAFCIGSVRWMINEFRLERDWHFFLFFRTSFTAPHNQITNCVLLQLHSYRTGRTRTTFICSVRCTSSSQHSPLNNCEHFISFRSEKRSFCCCHCWCFCHLMHLRFSILLKIISRWLRLWKFSLQFSVGEIYSVYLLLLWLAKQPLTSHNLIQWISITCLCHSSPRHRIVHNTSCTMRR